MIDEPDREILEQAIAKSERLLAELIAQQADLDRNPPKLEADRLAESQRAMQNAIAAARNTVSSLRAALSSERT